MIADDMIHGVPALSRRCRSKQRGKPQPARPGGRSPLVAQVAPVRWEDGLEIEPDPCGPFIADDAPILPDLMARCVWEDACVCLQTELPREWVRRLTNRANLLYQRNARVRALLRRRGDGGRDWLQTFMRHWLAALIRHRDENLFARLPAGYANGAEASLPQSN